MLLHPCCLMPNVIDIPSYDHAQEMSNLAANLASWHAQASLRPPYLAPSAHIGGCGISERFSREGTLTSEDSRFLGPRQTLPDEVLVEVSRYLHPRELIAFARLKKSLRRMLMSRNSQAIWTAALSRMIDLPPCPPYMTLPHYTALLFTRDCMVNVPSPAQTQ
ncbi:hypothetical protein BV20DRAFT_826015 [Pilatotrama ljubarskyi]|nr:hypothetical protein BV20DRAFT_826015 [Pilatotrama ljubarskyi]